MCGCTGLGIVAEPIAEIRAIAVPITIESHAPAPAPRKSYGVAAIRLMGKIQHDDHIVASAALIPSMKGEYFSGIIDMKDIRVLSPQSARIVKPVPAQVDQVSLQLDDACILARLA